MSDSEKNCVNINDYHKPWDGNDYGPAVRRAIKDLQPGESISFPAGNYPLKTVRPGMKFLAKVILLSIAAFFIIGFLSMLLGCANAERTTEEVPVVVVTPDAGEMPPPMPTDPVCPEQPPAQPDLCDDVLVCHGQRCYVRCCADSQCAEGESCRWGVCRSGEGWGK